MLPPARRRAQKILLIAVILIGAEAIVYVVFGAIAIASISGGKAGDSLGIGIFLAAYGLAQAFACRKLLQWHTWARGPLVFTQLIQLGLAWGLRDSQRPWLAVVMAISAAVALVCLLAPTVTRALIDEEPV